MAASVVGGSYLMFENSGSTWAGGSYTPGSGSNRIIRAFFVMNYQSEVTDITGVTFKGVAMTEAGAITIGNTIRVECWYIREADVDMSSAGTFAFTYTGTPATSGEEQVHLHTLKDVFQTAPVVSVLTGGNAGGATTFSFGIYAESANDLVDAFIGSFTSTNITADSPGTELFEEQNGSTSTA